MTDWIFHKPGFEYQPELNQYLDAFGWLGHTYFAYDLVANVKPSTVVELGTHWGVSFFSFCQATKDHSPTTKLYAVDTWKGEEHAGLYGEKVISKVQRIKEKYFSTLHIELLRKTFDEALADFDDQTIDLLHIDGLHTYDAVKHDFESWLPKLSKNGLVLFHDTAETGRGFGVHKFWGELSEEYPQTIQLPYCHGLGLLCLDEEIWERIKSLQDTWLVYYGLSHEKEVLAKDLFKANLQLEKSTKELTETSQRLEGFVRNDEQLVTQLEDTARHASNLQAMLDDIRSSKAYKLTHGLGILRRKIAGKL